MAVREFCISAVVVCCADAMLKLTDLWFLAVRRAEAGSDQTGTAGGQCSSASGRAGAAAAESQGAGPRTG